MDAAAEADAHARDLRRCMLQHLQTNAREPPVEVYADLYTELSAREHDVDRKRPRSLRHPRPHRPPPKTALEERKHPWHRAFACFVHSVTCIFVPAARDGVAAFDAHIMPVLRMRTPGTIAAQYLVDHAPERPRTLVTLASPHVEIPVAAALVSCFIVRKKQAFKSSMSHVAQLVSIISDSLSAAVPEIHVLYVDALLADAECKGAGRMLLALLFERMATTVANTHAAPVWLVLTPKSRALWHWYTSLEFPHPFDPAAPALTFRVLTLRPHVYFLALTVPRNATNDGVHAGAADDSSVFFNAHTARGGVDPVTGWRARRVEPHTLIDKRINAHIEAFWKTCTATPSHASMCISLADTAAEAAQSHSVAVHVDVSAALLQRIFHVLVGRLEDESAHLSLGLRDFVRTHADYISSLFTDQARVAARAAEDESTSF